LLTALPVTLSSLINAESLLKCSVYYKNKSCILQKIKNIQAARQTKIGKSLLNLLTIEPVAGY